MSLDDEIKRVHDRTIDQGVSERQWSVWELQAENIVRKLGFGGRRDVRRVANAFGRRIGK